MLKVTVILKLIQILSVSDVKILFILEIDLDSGRLEVFKWLVSCKHSLSKRKKGVSCRRMPYVAVDGRRFDM